MRKVEYIVTYYASYRVDDLIKNGRANKVVLWMFGLWLSRRRAAHQCICEGRMVQRSSASDEIVAVAAQDVDGLLAIGLRAGVEGESKRLEEGGGGKRKEKRDETTTRLPKKEQRRGRVSEGW